MPQHVAVRTEKLPAGYPALRKAVSRVLIQGQQQIEQLKVQTYWQTGRLIQDYLAKLPPGKYHTHRVIQNLADDLEIEQSRFYRMLQFSTDFPNFATWRNLRWSHYRELIGVRDPKRRKTYALRANQGKWNVRKLQYELQKTKRTIASQNPKSRLTPKRGKLGTYRIVDWQGSRAIDLGFSCYMKTTKRKSATPPPESDLYTYRALLERVIDGDTIWAQVALGFDFWTRQKLRLRGIDTPEAGTAKGERATQYLKYALTDCGSFVIRSSRSDKFDRYLADIFCDHVFLNQRLLDEGLAVRA